MDFYKELDDQIDSLRDEIVNTLSEFVKIPSVKGTPEDAAPFGIEIKRALDFFLKKCESFGLFSKNGDGYYGYADFGNSDQILGVFGHLDVVPSGNNWSVDPFSGTVVDGKMISRGTMDDKGALVSALFAIRALSHLGVAPSKTVRLFFGCDEESGFSCINRYIEKEKLPDSTIVVDGNFPVTYYEKGIFRFSFQHNTEKDRDSKISLIDLYGGEKLNIVAGEAKAVLMIPDNLEDEFIDSLKKWKSAMRENLENSVNVSHEKFIQVTKVEDGSFLVETVGKKAHSSVAEQGVSAISLLLNFLSSLDIEGKRFFEFFSKNVGLSVHGEGLGINAYDEESGHLTVNPGMISLKDGSILLQFDIRYPVTTNGNILEETLSMIVKDSPIHLCEVEDGPPMRTSPEGFLVKTLMTTYQEMTGIKVKPASMGGNTYAHVLPEAAAFGPNHPGKKKLAHMADEFVPLEDLILNTKIYARAIYQLVG
jgi:succinyl-diaminopimelate desuccinylase